MGSSRRRSQSGGRAERQVETSRRDTQSRSSRLTRRSVRRAARRRKAIVRLTLVAAPLVVVMAVIVALVLVLGGADKNDDSGISLTTIEAKSADGTSLLVVEQEEEVPALVLLTPRKKDGLALAAPGATLLKTVDGFKTMAELHSSDQDEVLRAALLEALGVNVGPVVSVEWSTLQAALTQMRKAQSLPTSIETTETAIAAMADAAIAMVDLGSSQDGAEIIDQIELNGDEPDFHNALARLREAVSSGSWESAVLPGKKVEGVGFSFFEPDVERARQLLAGEISGGTITLEVQNGSGVVGVAQEVGGMLAPLGYNLLPFSNAEGFPDVKQTRILAGPGTNAEASRVREALGVGKIEQDDTLAAGHLVVVVGKDFAPPLSTISGSAD